MKLVPAGIEGRVGEHRDTVEDNPVKQGPTHIPAAAPFPGFTLVILQQPYPGIIGIRCRRNCLIGADRGAHAAADAAVGRFGALPDTCEGAVFAAAFLFKDIKLGHPLPPVGQVNGLLGADGSALAAQGAPVFTVLDNPLQVNVC